jgi:hypothetical protein
MQPDATRSSRLWDVAGHPWNRRAAERGCPGSYPSRRPASICLLATADRLNNEYLRMRRALTERCPPVGRPGLAASCLAGRLLLGERRLAGAETAGGHAPIPMGPLSGDAFTA